MTPPSNDPLRRRKFGILIVLAACLALRVVDASDCRSSGDPGEIAAISAERQSFNLAIATKDLRRVERVLHVNAILVTGTDSEVYAGRDAQLAIWRSDFASADRALYARTTTCVRVSTMAPVALEVGSWRGQRGSAVDFAAGSYAAKWRRVSGAWKVEAEIYVTDTCGGDFCPKSTSTAQ